MASFFNAEFLTDLLVGVVAFMIGMWILSIIMLDRMDQKDQK